MKKTWKYLNKRNPPIQERFNISGKKFNFVTAISFNRKIRGALFWLCKCVCGKEFITEAKRLRSGKTKSCGCMKNILVGINSTTHGLRKIREYKIWASIKSRCTNANNLSYYRYGGRGIKICKRWSNSFQKFFDDMGKCPDGLSIERVNNDGNYGPKNCRWATRKSQILNRSNSVGIDLKEIAKKLKIGYKYAWSLHRAGRLNGKTSSISKR